MLQDINIAIFSMILLKFSIIFNFLCLLFFRVQQSSLAKETFSSLADGLH